MRHLFVRRLLLRGVLLVLLYTTMGVATPRQSVHARGLLLLPTSAITGVTGFGLTMGGPSTPAIAYVTAAGGLYRAPAPFVLWDRRTATTFSAVSPRPDNANDVVLAAGKQIYRSTDGGQTVTVTGSNRPVTAFARSARAPATIFGAGSDASTIYVYRSSDDGATWTTVYSATNMGYNSPSVGGISVGNTLPAHVVIGASFYHSGTLLASSDGGITWHNLPDPANTSLMAPQSVAINPSNASDIWAGWSVMGYGVLAHSMNGGTTWTSVPAGLPHSEAVYAIAFDALSGRVYVDGITVNASDSALPAQIAASRDGMPFERFASSLTHIGTSMAVDAKDGYLLASGSGSGTHLIVQPLIAPLQWSLAPPFSTYVASHNGARLLGRRISPTTQCGGLPCQYFEKGRLEDHLSLTSNPALRFNYGPIVAPLLASMSSLPIGGNTSTVTYASLHAVAGPGHRVAPPAGFHHGTMNVAGGEFIPDLPSLSPASGYIVPAFFWHEMMTHDRVPGGWLHDLGLPLTPAVPATVTKSGLGTRSIVIQAFQYAILTYDPHNVAAWQVEHANIGTDYARLFPQAVR